MAKIDTCDCEGCLGLTRRYKDDPVLLAFYRRQLLLRGWAGATDDVEKRYMAAHAAWYRSMQERGAELASQYPQPKRKAVTGEAPTLPDKESLPAPWAATAPGPTPAPTGGAVISWRALVPLALAIVALMELVK